VYFDITSISSYSSGMNISEYGYNRDKEKLKQINLGIISSSSSKLPLAYKSYPGSISDVSTISNLIISAKSWGISSILFILDCGFSSK
jgi:transposase